MRAFPSDKNNAMDTSVLKKNDCVRSLEFEGVLFFLSGWTQEWKFRLKMKIQFRANICFVGVRTKKNGSGCYRAFSLSKFFLLIFCWISILLFHICKSFNSGSFRYVRARVFFIARSSSGRKKCVGTARIKGEWITKPIRHCQSNHDNVSPWLACKKASYWIMKSQFLELFFRQ